MRTIISIDRSNRRGRIDKPAVIQNFAYLVAVQRLVLKKRLGDDHQRLFALR